MLGSIYVVCLLPISYITDKINSKLIKLMAKWYFRNIQFNTRNFNNLCYSNEFIKITNEVLKDKDFDYYKHIEDCLVKNKDNRINDENYIQAMKVMNFKSTNATHLLLFLETSMVPDSQIVPLDYTLEHIFCQKDKTKLSNQSLIDNIGNLTLLEGKNSDNGHKGNSSIGSKTYDKKIHSYKGSSCKITRDITEQFENFTESTIVQRNNTIVSLLNAHTNY